MIRESVDGHKGNCGQTREEKANFSGDKLRVGVSFGRKGLCRITPLGCNEYEVAAELARCTRYQDIYFQPLKFVEYFLRQSDPTVGDAVNTAPWVVFSGR